MCNENMIKFVMDDNSSNPDDTVFDGLDQEKLAKWRQNTLRVDLWYPNNTDTTQGCYDDEVILNKLRKFNENIGAKS